MPKSNVFYCYRLSLSSYWILIVMLLRREKVELRCWGENNLARFDLNVNDTWYFLCCDRCHATPHDCCYLLLVYFNHLTTFNECAHRCLDPNRSSPVKIIRVRRYNIHLSIRESQMESETLSHRWTELISRNFQRISLCCVWLFSKFIDRFVILTRISRSVRTFILDNRDRQYLSLAKL